MIRLRAKSTAEALLVRSGAVRLAQRWSPPRNLVLAYHNIVPDGAAVEGEVPLHLPRARFGRQLDLLTQAYEVVPLDRLVDEPAESNARLRAAITFDDAYRGAVTLGVEEVARRGLPATLFVIPASVGAGSFWWDALADGGRLPDDLRRYALDELRGEDASIRRWAGGRGLSARVCGGLACAAGEDELRAATRHTGIALASHTWSHPNLPRLAPEEVEAELRRSLDWLRERFDRVTPWLSFPYGRSTVEIGRIAARLGYRAALRIDGGAWRHPAPDPYALPRVHVPAGLSVNGFALRLAGLVCR